jgi:hypothetical protein
MRHIRDLTHGIPALLGVLLVACGASGEQGTDTTLLTTSSSTDVTSECPEYGGFPVVWPRRHELVDGTLYYPDRQTAEDSWPLGQSSFQVTSTYWALTPNHIYDVAPAARRCVGPDDRWMAVANAPDADQGCCGRWDIPFGNPAEFDEALWDQIIAHPWQLDRFGPPGSADQVPLYRGVVRFTDQLAVTSSICDTRPNVVLFRGEALAPLEWPVNEQTMVCVPPPGVDPLPPEESEVWHLPIGGVPSIDDGELVITLDGVEYRYLPISEDEFVRAFEREAFFPIEDPLTVLEDTEAESFDELDKPPTQMETTTTEPDETSTTES